MSRHGTHHRSLRIGRNDRPAPQLGAPIATMLEAASSTLDLEIRGAEPRGTAIVIDCDRPHASADENSKICSARADVLRRPGDLLGLGPPWRPHVAHGHLADRVERRSVRFGVTDAVRMQGAGRSRFTSMVEFGRANELRDDR